MIGRLKKGVGSKLVLRAKSRLLDLLLLSFSTYAVGFVIRRIQTYVKFEFRK